LHVRCEAGEKIEIISNSYLSLSVTQHEVLQTGIFGHLWTADLLLSKKVPLNTVYVMADPEFVGVMPIRQDIQVIPNDEPNKLRIGWVIYEEIGLACVNSMAVSKLVIS